MTKRTTRSTRRTAISFAIIAVGMLLSAIGLVADPVGASVKVPNPVPFSGNLNCASFGFQYEFKINGQPANGVYDANSNGVEVKGGVPAGTAITISNVESPNGRLEFDWASNQAWGAVLVKQANGGLRYAYNPAAFDDQDVQTVAGQNAGGISHVSFCGPGVVPPPTADVTLQKLTTGPADPADNTAFSFTVACESGTVPNSPVQILSNAAAVSVATGVTVGDDCTITETDAQGAASTIFNVDGTDQPAGTAVTVTVTSTTDVAVIATNDFPAAPPRTGDVTLAKATTGGTAPAPGTAFTFTVDCESGTETSPIQVLSGAAAVTVATDVVLGDDCTITETGTQGAASTVYSVDGNVQPAGTAVTVTVGSENGVAVVATNSYPTTPPPPPPPPPPGATTGSLSLDKVVTGDGAVDGTEFPFDIDCSNGLDTSVSLSDTDPAHVISNLPTGTTCEIVETDDGGATDTTWTGGTAIPGENGVSVTIGNGTTVTVTATNDFELEVLPTPPVVRPPTVTPPVVTPPAPPAPPTKVAGVVVPRSLPRTGTDALPLVELGLGMILLGFGAMLFGRERTALI